MALQETIKYKDFDGNDVEETFYFNISTAEMTKMELGMKGGLKAYFEKIIREDDRPKIVEAFDKILLASVGRRSGKLFLKTPEVVNEFRYSGAYEVMFLRLLTDAEYSANFVNQVFPSDMAEALKAASGTPIAVDLPTTPVPITPSLEQAAEKLASTTPDFSKMSQEDFINWQRSVRGNNPLGL